MAVLEEKQQKKLERLLCCITKREMINLSIQVIKDTCISGMLLGYLFVAK